MRINTIFAEKIMRKKRKKPFYEKVQINDIAADGKSIARVDNMVIFTKFVVPGDIVDLQVTKKRSKYQEAVVTKIHQHSADRTEAFCKHFGTCGGCSWQYLPYEKQLFYKQKQVADQFKRIGKVEIPQISTILGSEKNTFYRNKLEFTFSDKKWLTTEEINSEKTIENYNALGFHIPGLFDKVINIEKCWLQPEPSNAIRNFIYEYAIKNGYDFFSIKNKNGLLRTLIIRTSSTGEIMIIISFFKDDNEKIINILEALKTEFPEITSLMYVINGKGNDTINDLDIKTYHGKDFIYEEMHGLKFKVGPKSFYQTNSEQAAVLYSTVKNFAQLSGNELVYDLYCGTGTITNFLACSAKKIIGIEYVPEATEDAVENAKINNIDNTSFVSGDIKELLNEDFITTHGHPDVIVTDPPRAGMHPDVIKTILSILPEKIVYVSCNPATQARDISLMNDYYKIEKIQPVDMFPHTYHVENVALLVKR